MKIIVSFLLLFVCYCLTAQSRKEIAAAGVRKITETETRYENGKETTIAVSITNYDAKGNITEQKEFDKKNGTLKKHEKIIYDQQGNAIRITEYDAMGKEIKLTVFKYNKDNMKTVKMVYEPPGQLKYIRTYNYEK